MLHGVQNGHCATFLTLTKIDVITEFASFRYVKVTITLDRFELETNHFDKVHLVQESNLFHYFR